MPVIAALAVFVACVLWAGSFIATKVALESAPPLTVVTLRLLISAACFSLWMLTAGRPAVRRGVRKLLPLAGLSLLGTGLHYSTQTLGLQYTTASNASLYAVTAPITIVILAVLFLGEKLTVNRVAGVAIACAGVITVMGLETLLAFDLGGRILGDLLVLVSIVMWGMFTVFGKRLTDELGALSVTAIVTVIGALTMVPVGVVEMELRGFSLFAISPGGWLSIAFLGVTCSFLATLLYFVALERSESQKVGVFLYTIPPMTAFFAYLILGEQLSVNFFVGSALVLTGVFLTERG